MCSDWYNYDSTTVTENSYTSYSEVIVDIE